MDKSPFIVICIFCGILSIMELYLFSKDDSAELKTHSLIGCIGFGIISIIGLYGFMT